jgi:hypothetical protein
VRRGDGVAFHAASIKIKRRIEIMKETLRKKARNQAGIEPKKKGDQRGKHLYDKQ